MTFYCHDDNITKNKSLKSGNDSGTSCECFCFPSHFFDINKHLDIATGGVKGEE
jgi:hypothetical protein